VRTVGRSRALLATVLLATSAGCARSASGGEHERTIVVTIHFSHFDPSHIEVSPGETVRFVVRNADPIPHEFIVGDEAVQRIHEEGTEAYHAPRPGEFSIPPGSTRTTVYTFGPRDLLFGCHLPGHYAYGMRGSISVM
jgi:uncharacterized cupredoxin-like copper-binding protein